MTLPTIAKPAAIPRPILRLREVKSLLSGDDMGFNVADAITAEAMLLVRVVISTGPAEVVFGLGVASV